jgi:hypothetical protein
LGNRRQQLAHLFQSSKTLEKLTEIPEQKQIKTKALTTKQLRMITTKKRMIPSVSFLLLRRGYSIFRPEELFFLTEKPSYHSGKPFNRADL